MIVSTSGLKLYVSSLCVLILIPTLDVGGAESDLLRILPRLDRSRFRILVWPFLSHGSLALQFDAAGLTLMPPLGIGGKTNQSLSASLSGNNFLTSSRWQQLWRLPLASWNAIRSATRIARVARDNNVDVIHAVLPHAYLVASIAALMAGPALVMSRLSQNFYHRDKPLFGWIERNLLHRLPEIVVGNSQRIIDELKNERIPPSRLKLIHNGIDVEKIGAPHRSVARRELCLSDSCLVLTVVANLFPHKGHVDLMQALATVNVHLPGNWVVLACGRDIQGSRGSLIEFARKLGISCRIRFLGERHDIPTILAAADIHVSASHTESFPNNILEAMSAGVSIIATDVGGVAEQIDSGRSGLLVQPRNPAALAEAILKLARDPHLRAQLGSAAKERAIRLFPLEKTIAAFEEVYIAAAARK
jgi:glycosyltransferase involved in cell wall biosynthesis